LLDGILKSLGSLWTNLALNQRYSPYIKEADISTFRRRVEHEGLTFLTVTLPLIGKALDSFHSTSEWQTPPYFTAREVDNMVQNELWFKKAITLVPIFMGSAVEAALNGDPVAVDCVRQLSYVFYKLEVAYDEEKVSNFLHQFIQTDEGVGSACNNLSPDGEVIVERMRCLIGQVLCNTDPFSIRPRHGSGATACRTPNWKKYHNFRFYEKLDASYPYSEHFFASPTHLADELDKLENAPVIAVPQARVCLVPKDSRGPRVISCEPAELMFIQQGLMKLLYGTLENHRLTSGQIHFLDQSANRELARLGSITGDLATIDLSDASDRVSLNLVRRVFPPNWVRAFEACRSEETILPNGELVKLNKFAPMGSACCFPVEALIFWACVASATGGITWTKSLRQRPDIHVYGDDIIVPSNLFEVAMSGLETIGLKVNTNKSYWKGPFRESCGGDYYRGYDVTPVRVRKFLSKSRTSIATNADLANSFIGKFGYEHARSIVSVIETDGGYVYPRSELLIPAVIRYTPCVSNDVFFRRRWNKNLQRWEYRTLTLTSVSQQRQPANWSELLRMELSKDRSRDERNLQLRHLSSDGQDHDPYVNPIAILDSKEDPGWYTDPHSVVTKWVWTWLG
jgi:hypothetical protein